MSENEKIRLADVVTPQELEALVNYINAHKTATWHANILDWLGTQPEVLERMNQHKLLLTYFAYLLEAFLTQ